MRIECESCKEVVTATFAIDGGFVRATCPACDAKMTAVPAVPAPASGEPIVLVHGCPKCGTPRHGAPACPSCGLSSDRMAVFADARDNAVPEPVRAAWQRELEAWADPSRHDELIRLVSIHSCYAWAAGRYRDAARARKGDPIGDLQLDRLRRALEATMLATATLRRERKSKPYRALTAILVLVMIAIGAGVLYAMLVRGRQTAGEATPGPHARPAVQPLVPDRLMHPGSQVR